MYSISLKRLATVAVPARGLPVRLAATLTESGGAPIAGEPIRFVIDDVALCAADTDSTGRASCAVSGITAAADRDGCADVEVFADGVRGALDGLARSVRVLAC